MKDKIQNIPINILLYTLKAQNTFVKIPGLGVFYNNCFKNNRKPDYRICI